MATTLASLVVRVGADVSGVTAGLNTVQKRTRKLKKQFTTVTDSTLRMRDAFGVLAGATGLAFAAKKVFDLGAAVEETASKFNTVFGPAVGGAQQFLDEFATTAGLTVTQGRELLATTGAIVQGMGMGQQASSEFAQEIVRLSGDFSSFNNIPIEETSRAIQSALTGERESLKRLGIVILETDVQQKALAMTGKDTAKALTQQEKATATLALITERAGVAVGDLARTMDSPANRARKLQAEFLTLRDDIAHALLPAMGVFLEEIGNIGGEEGFTGLGKTIKDNSNVIAAWAKFTVEAMKFAAQAIAGVIRVAFNLGQVIGTVLSAAFQAMTGNLKGARETLGDVSRDFGDMKDAVDNVITGFDNMRVASGIAWQTVAGDGEGGGPADAAANISNVAGALHVANAEFREMNVQVPVLIGNMEMIAPTVVELTTRVEEAKEQLGAFRSQMRNTALQGVDAFVDFASGAGDALSNFVKRALKDLARLVARMLFVKAIMSFLPGVGSFLGFGGGGKGAGKFAGMFASGGFIPQGSFGIAGEAGPEKITRGPTAVKGPAHVTPMQSGGVTEIVLPSPRNMTDRIAIDWLAESLKQLEHSGFRVRMT